MVTDYYIFQKIKKLKHYIDKKLLKIIINRTLVIDSSTRSKMPCAYLLYTCIYAICFVLYYFKICMPNTYTYFDEKSDVLF